MIDFIPSAHALADDVRASVRANLHHLDDRARVVAADARRYGRTLGARSRAAGGALLTHARGYVDRVGGAIEGYVGNKIKARVKPPIVAALVLAGLAVGVAVVAVVVARRRRA